MEALQYKAPGTDHVANGWDFDTYDFIHPAQFNLKDRAVLITGASKGIGRDIARSYAHAGVSKIAIGARSDLSSLKAEIEAAAEKAGRAIPHVLTLTMDVADYASVEEAATAVENEFGRLDICINNAGYCETFANILDSKPEEWTRSWTVNVFGTYYVTRAFLPLLLKSPQGLKQILSMTSIGANVVMASGSGYNTSKLAISRFSECISAEYPEVLAFCLHPGGVMTELAGGLPKPLQALLTDKPQLAADTVVWLTSERREWLQGRYVSATWDMKELLEKREKIVAEDLLVVKLRVD